MNLFQLDPFTLPDGRTTHFKIECDVLTLDDWAALARLAVALLPPFGRVEGVPRGGVAFATALTAYVTTDSSRLLVADDVWVTGLSMNRYRQNLPPERYAPSVVGVVAFARNPVDAWVVSLLSLSPAAEDATYRLDQPHHLVV